MRSKRRPRFYLKENPNALKQHVARARKSVIALICCLSLLAIDGAAYTQEPQADQDGKADKIKKLDQEIELLKKQKERADLEKAKLDAERALQDSQSPAKDDALVRLNKEKERLTAEKEIAEASKAKAEAERASLDARLPKSETKALEGKITLDDSVLIEAQILAHEAMAKIADQIVKEIKERDGNLNGLIVYNERDVSNMSQYQALDGQIDYLDRSYLILVGAKRGGVSPILAPEIGTSILKSTIDLISLFRTDTEIKTKAVTIEEVALVSQLVRCLRLQYKRDIAVTYPLVFLPSILSSKPYSKLSADTASNIANRDLLSALRMLTEYRANAEQIVKEADKDRSTKLHALDEQYDKLMDYPLKIDDKTGDSPLTNLLRAEVLINKINKGDSSILYLKVLAAGGANKVTRNLFTGSKLYHKGATIISYILFKPAGDIVASNTIYNDVGYVKANKVRNNFDK